jgi:hypothetical protein
MVEKNGRDYRSGGCWRGSNITHESLIARKGPRRKGDGTSLGCEDRPVVPAGFCFVGVAPAEPPIKRSRAGTVFRRRPQGTAYWVRYGPIQGRGRRPADAILVKLQRSARKIRYANSLIFAMQHGFVTNQSRSSQHTRQATEAFLNGPQPTLPRLGSCFFELQDRRLRG